MLEDLRQAKQQANGIFERENEELLVLREKLIDREKRIIELSRKVKGKEDVLKRMRAERDRLTEVCNNLREDLLSFQKRRG